MAAELSGESEMPGQRSRGGGGYVSDLPRGRLLSATFALVGERGYEGVSARSVSGRAGVSNRTFYECFSDREDCFLAAFNHAVAGLESEVRAGWELEPGWVAGVRAGLAALLRALDREPAVSRLVFVEALGAGPRVLARRARVLESLAVVVDGGRESAQTPSGLPGLVAEGVVGATFGVIHARLLDLRPEPLVELLGSLMAAIVLPYRGSEAAARELERPVPRSPVRRRDGDGSSRLRLGAVPPVDYRLTVRTQLALAAVSGRPGLNNREVSELIGLADQGQISRMMKRLQAQGLIENMQGHARRQVRAWRLTADGEAVIDAHRVLKRAQRKLSRGGKLVAPKSGRRGKTRIAAAGTEVASAGFRMTALTHEVLTAVAGLGGRGSGPSNRELAQAAGVKDEGQISKLLRRLEDHGLIENPGGLAAGSNAWRLTPRGEELLSASRPAPRPAKAGVRRKGSIHREGSE
jgi:AcrR family transcriptional regulator/DNA-binding MarR family transcriptional regulator